MELGFVIAPNLPKNDIKTILIGEKYVDSLGNILVKQGISVISIPANKNIAPQISSHADMSVLHLGSNRLVAADAVFEKLKNLMPDNVDLLKAANNQNSVYPGDIGLNACIIGDKLFHNLKFTDPLVLSEAKALKYTFYNVKQGYTKCSVCVLNSDSIITSDKGIHELATSNSIKSLLISSGSIILDGYDSGFIGGCSFKLSINRIAFTGKLHLHPDENKILNFIKETNLEIVFLTDRPIFDVGSLIPLQECQTNNNTKNSR